MSRTVVSKFRSSAGHVVVGAGGIQKLVETTGRLPPVTLILKPLDGSAIVPLDRFLTYRFQSSILVPVDSFDFTFVAPDSEKPFDDIIKEGDIITLNGAGTALSTGIVDMTDVEVDDQFGERVQIQGRDLLSQFEDQDAISVDDKPIWADKYTVSQAAAKLAENTRIKRIETRSAPVKPYLFATEPGESKLAALQRYLEPLNCIAWMSATGSLRIGKPNMAQSPRATLLLSKKLRDSNVLAMKATRASTRIPNIVVPIWSGQENVQDRVQPQQRLLNAAERPNRLRKLGHRVSKSVVVSTPQGSDPQELAGVNSFLVAGAANILQAHAKREIARKNFEELLVQVVVPGHYNELGEPYLTDTVYKIRFDRGKVDENMYLYGVDYQGSNEAGQKTTLHFCRLGTIVSDVRAP